MSHNENEKEAKRGTVNHRIVYFDKLLLWEPRSKFEIKKVYSESRRARRKNSAQSIADCEKHWMLSSHSFLVLKQVRKQII